MSRIFPKNRLCNSFPNKMRHAYPKLINTFSNQFEQKKTFLTNSVNLDRRIKTKNVVDVKEVLSFMIAPTLMAAATKLLQEYTKRFMPLYYYYYENEMNENGGFL